MRPSSYMRSVVDRNVVMRHIPVYPDLTRRTDEGMLGTLQRNRGAMDVKLVMNSCDMTLAQFSHCITSHSRCVGKHRMLCLVCGLS
jgi:hypothetical protein